MTAPNEEADVKTEPIEESAPETSTPNVGIGRRMRMLNRSRRLEQSAVQDKTSKEDNVLS